ncbi:S-layer homology domain-containing protein [Cohnella sp. GCM10020058]|uniref:S-layer homology domain-containing protein n=1 Tax=Cohnella sp. GCM10020058 TaxID=3317330 RepID=UPI00363DCCEB
MTNRIRYTKKWPAAAMAFIMLFSLLVQMVGVQPAAAASPTTIASWDFDGSSPLATGGTPANAGIAKMDVGGGPSSTLSYVTGVAGKAISTTNWQAGTGYWTTIIDTDDYSNIVLSWKQYGSNTGPKEFKLQYSTNGIDYTDVNGAAVSLAPGAWSSLSNITLPADASNQSKLYLKWLNTSTVAISSASAVASSGTNRLDDIVVSGTPISGGGETPVETTAAPIAGKLSLAEDLQTLSGAAGAVSVNASVYVYADATTLIDRAVADGSGAFSMTVNNPSGKTSLLVSAVEAGKAESAKVSVSAPVTTTPVSSKITYKDYKTVTGLPGAVSAGAAVYALLADGTTPVGETTAASDGSFGLTFSPVLTAEKLTIVAKSAGKLISASVTVNRTSSTSTMVNAGDVVFSQVMVNGGAAGIFKNRFFELYNRTDSDIDLSGWVVAYSSSGTSSFSATSNQMPIGGVIKAHSYFLVMGSPLTSATSTAPALPVAADSDTTAGSTLNTSGASSAGTGGIIGLIQKSGVAVSSPTDANLVDLLAYANADTVFAGKTMFWGAPFIATDIAGGVIIRKTAACTDPRAAFGTAGVCYTKDASKDFTTWVPKAAANPAEIVVKNSAYKGQPAADKIVFNGTTGLTGAAGAAVAGSTVRAYTLSGGVLSSAGSATAGPDGAFSLSVTNPGGEKSVYVTHSYAGNESVYTRVNAAGYTPEPLTIADAKIVDSRGLPVHTGEHAELTGVVTVGNGVLGTSPTHYYIQDETGAVNIIAAAAPAAPVALGTKVKVTGTIAFAGGATKLLADSAAELGADVLPAPVAVDAAKINAATTAEPLEGKLVSFKGKVTNIPTSDSDVSLTVADAAGNTAVVQLLKSTGISAAAAVTLNETFTFTGILAQSDLVSPYDSGYKVLPRSASDIKGELQLAYTPPAKLYTGMDLSFEAKAKFADSVTLFYKGAAGDAYTSISLTSADQLSYNGKIAQANVPQSGKLYFYVKAVSGADSVTSGSAAEPYVVDIVEDLDGPAVTNLKPAEGDRIETQHPVISATLSDPNGIATGTVSLKIDGTNFTSSAVVNPGSVELTLTSAQDLAIGDHEVAIAVKDNLGNASVKKWTFTIEARFTGGNHYYGTTHNHTNISHDAAGTPQQALDDAKYYGYDWFAFSDHSHDIDASIRGTDADTASHGGMPERKGGSDWALTKQISADNTKDGEFVVFPAFEMTSTTWGHSNVFGTENFIDRIQDGGKYQNLNQYYAWVLTYDDVVAQFNHANAPTGAFNSFLPYDKKVDKLFTMFEVGNGSGKYSYTNMEDIYFSALDKGWHIAPTYGEDNHDATWGKTKRRTVIVAKDLSMDSLMDAMKKMRVYMTEDPNAKLDASANGWYMGSTVDSKTLSFNISGSDDVWEDKSDPHYAYLPAATNDNVAKVDLITNGGTIAETYKPSSASTSFNWKPTVTVAGGQQWFIVRVTQADGDQIYSAPFWSEEVPVAVKVSSVEAADGAIVGGNAATLNAILSNQGTEDVSGITATFYVDKQDAEHLIGTASIEALASSQSATASVVWATPPVGEHKLIVTLKTADQELSTYEKALSIKAPLGKTILIDASKNNENTTKDTGTYKDNLKSFTKQMRLEGYTVVENGNAITSAALGGVSILYISHPSSAYGSSEIDAIKAFVAAGGSLWLADKSNFSGSNQNLNPLLSAVGSSILINNDGIADETAYGNFWGTPLTSNYSVRLHPSPVASYVTDFVSTLEYYSGSSLARNDGAGNKVPLANSDTVTILARGNDSTFQISSQMKADTATYNVSTSPAPANLTGGAVIPAIASEQLGAGRVIVSGMNVFNDKQMDESYNDKGNNELAMNAMNWLAHRDTVVTSIGDARKLAEGSEVVVQGTVTSAAGVFFDAFYLEDATGGIMAFNEVPENALKLGDVVRVYGHVKVFENNFELEFDGFDKSVVKVSAGAPKEPTQVSTAASVSSDNQGRLVKVTGAVTEIPDNTSYVIDDGSGPVLVFADGYIINQSGPIPVLQIGDRLEAVGVSGGYSGGLRIRVRNTTELKKVDATAAEIAAGIASIAAPEKDATQLVLPTVPSGYMIAIKSSDSTVIGTDGKIVPPTAETTVKLILTVTRTSDATTGDTAAILVVVPAKTETSSTPPPSTSTPPPSSSTPTPSPTPTPTPAGTATISKDSIKLDSGRASVELAAGTTDVKLNADALAAIGDRALVLNKGSLSVQLPSVLLTQLLAQLPAGARADASIELQMTPVSASDTEAAIGKNAQNGRSTIRLAGEVYEFSLKANGSDGTTTAMSQFSTPITLSLAANAATDPDLTGVYYIGDDGKLAYVGGTLENGVWTVNVRHFSKYAVLEVKRSFADVTATFWASRAIASLAAKQIVSGVTDTKFEPGRTVTRAEFTKLLVETLGLTDQGAISFKDVASNAWYAQYVAIAAKAGLVSGKSADIFDPNGRITREEMAVMLVKAYKTLHANAATSGVAAAVFSDGGSIAVWAKADVDTANALGLLKGRAAGTFAPKGTATRAEAAQAIFNLIEMK